MRIQKALIILLLTVFACQPAEKKNNKETLDEVSNNTEYWKDNTDIGKHLYDAGNIGFWSKGHASLPVFHFTADLPLVTKLPDGELVNYPVDPWFLIGNYRLNCFVHTSGGYQLMSMERAISRLNYAGERDTFACHAALTVNNNSYELIGLNSDLATDKNTEKAFGAGFASFAYPQKEGLKVIRILSTVPSKKVNEGCSAFLLSVDLENTTDESKSFEYAEGLTACYQVAVWNNPPFRNKRAHYEVRTSMDDMTGLLSAEFIPIGETDLVFGKERKDHALADGFPPALKMQLVVDENFEKQFEAEEIDAEHAKVTGKVKGVVPANSSIRLNYIIGYLHDDGEYKWGDMVKQLKRGASEGPGSIPFRRSWRKVVPEFKGEKNDKYRYEMQWSAYVLEAMANYSEYYDETYIPQGNVYEYGVGVSAAICDHMVHSLPVNYFNPDLSKSILRFTLKHANFRGLIYASDEGAGRMPLGAGSKSNSYTYMLMALTEYFRVTGDGGFLEEEIPFFGMDYAHEGTVLDRIERIFLFFRDEVAVGQRGLPRLLNSDWNDCFYFFFHHESYHYIFGVAESHMNATMGAKYLKELADELEKLKSHSKSAHLSEEIDALVKAMRDYQKEVAEALLADLGDRDFVSRAYIGQQHIGDTNLFLEPQIFALGVDDIPMAQRKQIWQSVKSRVWDMEKQGARQNQYPLKTDFEDANGGSRENGGFWYSLNGPLVVNLIDVDKDAAWKAWEKTTLNNHAAMYPNYWVGIWSGGDSYDSSILPTEGITNKYLFPFPVYCAHPHAWPLWGYYRLTE